MDIDREAEQATIGAILLEPERYADVREWLEPEDFDGLRERAAYAAIAEIAAEERTPTPDAVNRNLQDAASRDDSPLQPDGVFLADCIHVCPMPSRAATYGRMVLELSIRRQIATGAAALQQRAASATTSNDLTLVFARVDMLRRDVEYLHEREALAHRAQSPSPLKIAVLPAWPAQSGQSDAHLERKVVRALVERPESLDQIRQWLRPEDFSDDASAAVLFQLFEMSEAGSAIDRVTVRWEARRRAQGVAALHRVDSESDEHSAQPLADARRVLRSAVSRRVVATAIALADEARHFGGGVNDITAAAHQRLNALWIQQRRIVTSELPTPVSRGHS